MSDRSRAGFAIARSTGVIACVMAHLRVTVHVVQTILIGHVRVVS